MAEPGPEHPAPPPHPIAAWDCYIKAGQGPQNRADPQLSNLVEMGGMSREDWQREHQRGAAFAYLLTGFLLAFVVLGVSVVCYSMARQWCG